MLNSSRALCLLIFLTMTAQSVGAAAPLCSQVLNFDPATDQNYSPEQTAWLRANNRRVNERLAESPNRKYFEQWFHDHAGESLRGQEYDLGGNRSLALIDRGLEKPQEVVLKTNGKEELLFSNFSQKSNNSARILDLKLSPTKQHAIITVYRKGSLDDFEVFVVDLQTKKLVVSNLLNSEISSNTVMWTSPHSFTFFKEGSLHEYTLETPPTIRDLKIKSMGSSGGLLILGQKEGSLVQDPLTQRKALVKEDVEEILGVVKDDFYFVTSNEKGYPEIRRGSFGQSAAAPSDTTLTIPATNHLFENAFMQGDQIFLSLFRGNDRRLRVFDLNGRMSGTVDVRSCCSVTGAEWIKPGEVLELTLTSPVVRAGKFLYNVKTKTYDDPLVEQKMMTYEGQEYETQVVQIPSTDGVKIPTRITKRKDTPLNGEAPTYMTVYGGFGSGGLFMPRFNPFPREFMRHGGLLVFPAVRGGDEKGPQWHTSAMGVNKHRTIEDVISVSRYLARHQYSDAQRIILTGTSNGGMVTAASTLTSPRSIGLTIPINGVYNLLQSHIWDARRNGWSSEWGSPKEGQFLKSLSQISPVELATHQEVVPRILLISGLNDSRVNPAHSSDLALRLQARGSHNVDLYSVRNAGHWLESMWYQNTIGWRTSVVVWTTIYDHLGWNTSTGRVGARVGTGLNSGK